MCKLIDPSVMAIRLRAAIEQLFQASNQAAYLRCVHPSIATLGLQMGNRLFFCIDELDQIVKEIEPRKIDTGGLTLEDVLTLEGYAEIRRGLVKSWQFIETRERAIIGQMGTKIADPGSGAGQ